MHNTKKIWTLKEACVWYVIIHHHIKKYIPQYSQIYSKQSGKQTTQNLTHDIKPIVSHIAHTLISLYYNYTYSDFINDKKYKYGAMVHEY